MTRSIHRLALLAALFVFPGLVHAAGEATPAPLTKIPASVAELKDLQKKVQDLNKKVMPSVVGLQVGGAAGSGVIISEDGMVLTAGHVSGQPDRKCVVILPDGKRVEGKTLGQNRGIDSGLIKITTEGKYPFTPMGDSKSLQKGQWVVALGHPNGYFEKRKPVLRLGRIITANDNLIQTDCTLVGGDSGGPLFSLEGKVIGIHSRIGPSISFNIHVPVSTYTETWDRLVSGESWGNMFGAPSQNRPRPTDRPPSHGLAFEKLGEYMKIINVEKDSPAEKAGIKAKDFFTKLEGKSVSTLDDINAILKGKKPGDEVTVEVLRGAERLTLKLKLGRS